MIGIGPVGLSSSGDFEYYLFTEKEIETLGWGNLSYATIDYIDNKAMYSEYSYLFHMVAEFRDVDLYKPIDGLGIVMIRSREQ